MLDIVEHHFHLVHRPPTDLPVDRPTALEFLLQTLAPLDVATRGFLEGTQRYAEQRARADGLADRDKFRTALVNSLQEGFFVADQNGAVIEMNNALVHIVGFPAGGPALRVAAPLAGRHKTAREQTVGGPTVRLRRIRDPDPASRRPPRLGGGEHQRGPR